MTPPCASTDETWAGIVRERDAISEPPTVCLDGVAERIKLDDIPMEVTSA